MKARNLIILGAISALAGLCFGQTSAPAANPNSKAHLLKQWYNSPDNPIRQADEEGDYEENKYYTYSTTHGADYLIGKATKKIEKEFPKIQNTDLVESFDQRRMKNAKDAVESLSNKREDLKTAADKLNKRRDNFDRLANQAKADEARLRETIKDSYKNLDSAGKLNEGGKKHLEDLSRARAKAQEKQQLFHEQKNRLDVDDVQMKLSENKKLLNQAKQNLNNMEASMNRAEKAQNAIFWTQMFMAAWDVSKAEQASAKRENRQVSKANQVWDFSKRVSGYAAYEGLYNSTQYATMNALYQKLEEYDKLGMDISDKEIFNRAVAHAIREGVKTGMYEGAKIVPVAGDLIAGKEMFDAAGEAYIELENTENNSLVNSNERYQIWMRAARKAEMAADNIQLTCELVKDRTAKMENAMSSVQGYIKQFEQLQEQKQTAAKIINEYLEQQKVFEKNPATTLLSTEAQDNLLKEITQTNAESLEQLKNIERVKTEFAEKKMTPEGVANNRKFITDLFAPTDERCKNLITSLEQLAIIAKGSELATKLPDAVKTLSETQAKMDELVAKSEVQTLGYIGASDELEVALGEYNKSKKLLAKTYEFIGAMTENLPKDINEKAYDRICVARERGFNAVADTNKAQAMINQANGLAKDNQRISAMSDMTKAPSLPESDKLAEMAAQATAAMAKLSAPATDMTNNTQKVRDGLAELASLSGGAEVTFKDEPIKASPLKKYSQNELLTITGDQIAKEVAGELVDGNYKIQDRKTWAGFTVNPETAKQVSDRTQKTWQNLEQVVDVTIYTPYYRMLKKGSMQVWYDMNQNKKQDSDEKWMTRPYWIFYTANIRCSDHRWNYYVRKDGILKSCYSSYESFMNPKSAEGSKYQVNFQQDNIPGADIAASGTQTYTFSSADRTVTQNQARAFAIAGCFTIEVDVDVCVQMDRMIVYGSMYESDSVYNEMLKIIRNDWPDSAGVLKDFDFYMTGRAGVAKDAMEKLVQAVTPYVEFTRQNFILSVDDLMPEMSGYTCTTKIKPDEYLVQSASRSFIRKWTAFQTKNSSKPDEGRENYTIYIRCITPSYKKSWKDVLDECDAEVQKNKKDPKYYTAFSPGLTGADSSSAYRSKINQHTTYETTNPPKTTFYNLSEYIRFAADNVVVTVEGWGSNLPEAKLHTAEVAQSVIEKIKAAKAKNKAKY